MAGAPAHSTSNPVAPQRVRPPGNSELPTVQRALSQEEARAFMDNLGRVKPREGAFMEFPMTSHEYQSHWAAYRQEGDPPPHGFVLSDGSFVIPWPDERPNAVGPASDPPIRQ